MTRPSELARYVRDEWIGTLECAASLNHYDPALNRSNGLSQCVGCQKPSHNIVEATITGASRGSKEQSMSQVFVVDTNKHPLQPVHPGRARLLLSSGKAAVLKHYPFSIILKTAIEKPEVQPLRI